MPDVGTLLGFALAAGAIAAAAWAGIRSSDRSIIQKRLDEEREESANQRAIREDVEARFAKYKTEKEAELAAYKAEKEAELATLKAETDAKIASQAADLAVWQRTVTGEAHWVALGQQLDEFEERTGESLDELRQAIAQVVGLVEGKP